MHSRAVKICNALGSEDQCTHIGNWQLQHEEMSTLIVSHGNVWNTTPGISAAANAAHMRKGMPNVPPAATTAHLARESRSRHTGRQVPFVEAGEEDDGGADPPHEEPRYLEHDVISAVR